MVYYRRPEPLSSDRIAMLGIWISKCAIIIACCLILKQKYRSLTSKLDAIYFFRKNLITEAGLTETGYLIMVEEGN